MNDIGVKQILVYKRKNYYSILWEFDVGRGVLLAHSKVGLNDLEDFKVMMDTFMKDKNDDVIIPVSKGLKKSYKRTHKPVSPRKTPSKELVLTIKIPKGK